MKVFTAIVVLLTVELSLCQEPSLATNSNQPARTEENVEPEKPRVIYDATWDSIDSRPIPAWYDTAKFGIMLHWGIYSVPGVGSEWFWWTWKGQKKPSFTQFIRDNYKPQQTYAGFAESLTATFFNPAKWAELLENSGARYAVITAKHHDGYCMWPSPYSHHWNSLTSGPARDIVGDFVFGIRQHSRMKVGVYYSLYEWFNPAYLMDKNTNFTLAYYPGSKAIPELKDLVERYTPDLLWSSGDWEAPMSYWNSTEFLQWLYNVSPVKDKVVVNDRWGDGSACKHGGFLTCVDGFNPKVLQPRKFENAMSMDKFSWGYRRNAHAWDFLETKQILKVLAETVSCGGNLLLNVGCSPEGTIAPIYEERLLQLGRWFEVNGEGIYGTRPWIKQNDTLAPDVWYTQRVARDTAEGFVYAIFLKYPTTNLVLRDPQPSEATEAILLGYGKLAWTVTPEGMSFELPVLQALPPAVDYAWIIKMSKLVNK